MNLKERIQSLHREKEILDETISTLERIRQLSKPFPPLITQNACWTEMDERGEIQWHPTRQPRKRLNPQAKAEGW
jgi:hypothetical protein